MRVKRPLFSLAAVLTLAGIFSFGTGCSKIGGDVTGSVTLNGKPMTAGSVTFHYEGGVNASAAIGTDGSYHLVKPPKGTANVTVEPPDLNTGAGVGSGGNVKPVSTKLSEQPKTTKPEPVWIPDKYKNPKTSGLSITVSGSNQSFDIAMTGEAKSDKDDKDNKNGKTDKK